MRIIFLLFKNSTSSNFSVGGVHIFQFIFPRLPIVSRDGVRISQFSPNFNVGSICFPSVLSVSMPHVGGKGPSIFISDEVYVHNMPDSVVPLAALTRDMRGLGRLPPPAPQAQPLDPPRAFCVGTGGGLLTASNCGKADSPSTLGSAVGSSAAFCVRTGALQ